MEAQRDYPSAAASVLAPAPVGHRAAPGLEVRPNAVRLLASLAAVLLALRLAYIAFVPDLDGDAYAHFEIGRAVLQRPADLGPHWVWLPGYHFVLAGLQTLGASFADVRRLNALLQAGAPLLLYVYARLRHDRGTALFAAVCWSVCSIPNAVGTSALGEVPYTLFILAAAFATDAGQLEHRRCVALRRAALAGVLLTCACAMRYEAWAAVGALGAVSLVGMARERRAWTGAPAFVIPATAIGGYVVFRRVMDGEWLWFIRETLEFTTMQRDVLTRSRLFELTWFPFVLPFKLLGPALFLVPLGVGRPRTWSRSACVPIAIAAFLLALYMGRSVLGLARYFSALMPFACVLIARGAAALDRRWLRTWRRPATILAIVSLVVTMFMTITSFGRLALADRAALRRDEARVSGR